MRALSVKHSSLRQVSISGRQWSGIEMLPRLGFGVDVPLGVEKRETVEPFCSDCGVVVVGGVSVTGSSLRLICDVFVGG